MTANLSRPARPSRRVAVFVLFALAAGCGPTEDIRTYTVPKAPEPKANPPAPPEPTAEPGTGEYRILGAMFPADDPKWFVKLTGKVSVLKEQEAAFDQFLSSLRFPNGPTAKPEWDLPAGWQEGTQRTVMGSPVFVVRVGTSELTVQPVGGGVEMNLNRWANQQLGTGTPAAELTKFTQPIEAKGGVKGLRVDMTGPKNPSGSGGMGPMMGGGK